MFLMRTFTPTLRHASFLRVLFLGDLFRVQLRADLRVGVNVRMRNIIVVLLLLVILDDMLEIGVRI